MTVGSPRGAEGLGMREEQGSKKIHLVIKMHTFYNGMLKKNVKEGLMSKSKRKCAHSSHVERNHI